MNIFAKNRGRAARLLTLFLAFFFEPILAQAGNKVVVIPLGGDDGLVPPFAPVAAASPADAHYLINDNGTPLNLLDDTVTDISTGLVWQRVDDNGTYNPDEGVNYCANLVLPAGGATDWRLPEIGELLSITDYAAFNPAVNSSIFPSMQPSLYWSITPQSGYAPSFWALHFKFARTETKPRENNYYVLCVR